MAAASGCRDSRPRRLRVRAARLGLGVLLAAVPVGAGLVGSAAVGVAPAGADPLADCSTTVGVVVAVELSGQVQRGCDATVSTALAALQANFTVTGTAEYGDAFVCQIDGQPSDQTCQETPPASASWSLWYADVGQADWTYSDLGPASLVPRAGSVEAWTFGASQPDVQPPFTPAAVRATNLDPVAPDVPPTTTTTVAAAATPPPAAASPGSVPSPTSGGATATTTVAGRTTTTTVAGHPAGNGATTTTTTTGASHSGATTTTTTSTTPGRHHLVIVDARSPPGQPSSGSPVPLIVGGVLVVLVAGAAGVLAWRRRQAG